MTSTTLLRRAAVGAFTALFGCAGPPSPKTQEDAHNRRAPETLVREHLRFIEAGELDRAEDQLAPGFTMQMKGMPFFVSIKRADALVMHRARKRAFPDFKFNEKIVKAEGNAVTIAVFLSGTHTGYLDYPLKEVPKLRATGRTIALPVEYFTYFVEDDKIRHIFGDIPEGSGPPALKKQLGVD
jgi:predicted ester cyclase